MKFFYIHHQREQKKSEKKQPQQIRERKSVTSVSRNSSSWHLQSQDFLKFSVLLFSLASMFSNDTVSSMNSNQFLISRAEVVFYNLRITLTALTNPTCVTVLWCFEILGIIVWSFNSHGDMGITVPSHFPMCCNTIFQNGKMC